VILPVLRLEAFYRFSNGGEILFINEMSAVTTATLLQLRGIVVKNTFASIAVDAFPIRPQERCVHKPCLILVGI
jgi:hypothetical protein